MDDAQQTRYIRLTNEELKKRNYPAVMIYVTPVTRHCVLGAGNRMLYWIGSDGHQVFFYHSSGNAILMSLRDFQIQHVVGAEKGMTEGGRYLYLKDNVWMDLGPISPSGVRHEDLSLESIKRQFRSASERRSDELEETVNHYDKLEVLDDFLDLGGSLDNDVSFNRRRKRCRR